MAYKHIALTVNGPKPSHNGWIIISCTIAMEFHPLQDKWSYKTEHKMLIMQQNLCQVEKGRYLICYVQDVIKDRWSVGMSSYSQALDGSQVLVQILQGLQLK